MSSISSRLQAPSQRLSPWAQGPLSRQIALHQLCLLGNGRIERKGQPGWVDCLGGYRIPQASERKMGAEAPKSPLVRWGRDVLSTKTMGPIEQPKQ